jgi:hypothetical protein
MKKTKALFVPAILLTLGAAFFTALLYPRNSNMQTASASDLPQNSKESEIPQWEADPRPLFSDEDWRERSKDYFTNIELDDSISIPIPGLRGAWSIDYETKKPAFGTHWTPQGLAHNEKYIFISAYDSERKDCSLIFLLDRQTGEYIRTLILPNKAHVGGLAYNSDHQILYISADNKKTAKLGILKLETIENYDAKTAQQPVTFDYEIQLPFLRSTSSVDYCEYAIYIPNFSLEKGKNSIVSIPVDIIDGTLDAEKLKSFDIPDKISEKLTEDVKKSGLLDFVGHSTGFPKAQGLDIYRNIAVFTTSYGPTDSKIILANRRTDPNYTYLGGRDLFEKELEIKLPPYLEEPAFDLENHLLMLIFESGATKYRSKTNKVIDRLIRIKIDIEEEEWSE